jgi:hypothetical protein
MSAREQANKMLSREARLEDLDLVAALIAERDELRGVVEQQKALIARNHRAYLSIQGIDTSHLDGTGIAASRPRIDAQGVTGASGSTRDGETVGDE